MFKNFYFLFLVLLFSSSLSFSQCNVGQKEVIIEIIPDNYPDEISWNLRENGIQIASGNYLSDTVCMGENTCLQFTIFDSYGDGICCGQGNGSYNLYSNGSLVQTGGNYTSYESYNESCPAGFICENPIPISEGIFLAPSFNYFYSFVPTVTGNYYLTTCNQSACDTKLWIYDNCSNAVNNADGNGALFYDDDGANCGTAAGITAYLVAGTNYNVKVGLYDNQSCPGEIGFELSFLGEVIGCTDPSACNYNPLATISDGICYGVETIDCAGNCNGNAISGDLNADQNVQLADVELYISGILDQSVANSVCLDLSNDDTISVWDAALAANCAINPTACVFPNEINNLNETVEIGFSSINSLEQYLDIYIKNPQTQISAFELNIAGISIAQVESLVDLTQFPNNPRFVVGGSKIIALSMNDSLIATNSSNTPFLRVHFDSMTSNYICVENVVHCLNQNFSPTKVNLIDACANFVGIDENLLANFSIYPNPSADFFSIVFQNPISEDFQLNISDALGRIVYKIKISDSSQPFTVDTSLFENGLYQVSISQNNFVKTKRLIIAH